MQPAHASSGQPAAAPSPAVAAAAAAYKAGFRGWPLVVMTAIAGRESSWDPKAGLGKLDTNGYPSTGLWQINAPSAGGLSPTQLANPITNARQAYKLAGGNSLSGLSNWALANGPASGVVPKPIYGGYYEGGSFHTLDYSIAQFIPEATRAAAEVEKATPAQLESWVGDIINPNWAINNGPMSNSGLLGGLASLPGSVAKIADAIANLGSRSGPFASLFHLLSWITSPKSWLRIFCGIAGLVFAAGGVVALAGVAG